MAPAGVESRADTGEVHRGANESLAHAAAIGREVIGTAIGVDVARRFIACAAVDELGRDDFAIAQPLAVAPQFLIHH